jgi:transcriptional regulator with AAA-type ATPase domain
MSSHLSSAQAFLTFPDSDRSPLSIRAKALVFADPRSQALRERMEVLAATTLPVLIQGETGTGKELLARHLHKGSDRPGLFVSVNCGAISPTHAHAELFGHVSNASPVSAASRAGWFGSATGGTLYLDEIADLSLPLQAALLEALENHEVVRVGASQPMPVEVRLVAASSIDLSQAVAAGKFNPRLWQYLAEGRLALPALRERPGDILPLADYFLGVYSQRLSLPVPAFSEAATQLLLAHPWPGNTRELENVVHFALLVREGEDILPVHLNQAGVADPLAALERQLALCVDASRAETQQAALALIARYAPLLGKNYKQQ